VAGKEDMPDNAVWGNTKLGLMLVACISACVAQFYPLPFPLNRALLAACVFVYFLISGILQYITTFVDRDVIFYGLATPTRPACILRTRMGKYEGVYTVTAECPPGVVVGTSVRTVGWFYTAEGFLLEKELEKELDEVLLPRIRAVGKGKGKQ